jgi:hypothetical protein
MTNNLAAQVGNNSVIDQAARAMLGLDRPNPRLQHLDLRIADCHTRRKAAIMRAARATREV